MPVGDRIPPPEYHPLTLLAVSQDGTTVLAAWQVPATGPRDLVGRVAETQGILTDDYRTGDAADPQYQRDPAGWLVCPDEQIHDLAGQIVTELRAAAAGETTPDPATPAPAAQVETVLDVLAPKTDVDPEYLAVLGLTQGVRVPVIRFEFEGRAVMPSVEQIRALAEQIVTAIRTTAGPAGTGESAGPTGQRMTEAYEAGASITAANLLARIKRIEQPDGTWPGADVVQLLTDWFTDLGIDIEAPAAEIVPVSQPGRPPGTGTRVHGLPRPTPCGPCICKGRGGHTDPACPWYGTDGGDPA